MNGDNMSQGFRLWMMRLMFKDVQWFGSGVVIASDKPMASAHFVDGKSVFSHMGYNITVLRER
jgi:hypothetical protein